MYNFFILLHCVIKKRGRLNLYSDQTENVSFSFQNNEMMTQSTCTVFKPTAHLTQSNITEALQ